MFRRAQNALHTLEVNYVPRSDTMSPGRPWTRNTWWKSTVVVSFSGIRQHVLENRSIATSIVLNPSDSTKCVTMSRAMWDHEHCGIGRGSRRPVWSWWLILDWAQVTHVSTNSCTFRVSEGHQNQLCIRAVVWHMPGWPELGASRTHCITLGCKGVGT